jgi:hypothetical protein
MSGPSSVLGVLLEQRGGYNIAEDTHRRCTVRAGRRSVQAFASTQRGGQRIAHGVAAALAVDAITIAEFSIAAGSALIVGISVPDEIDLALSEANFDFAGAPADHVYSTVGAFGSGQQSTIAFWDGGPARTGAVACDLEIVVSVALTFATEVTGFSPVDAGDDDEARGTSDAPQVTSLILGADREPIIGALTWIGDGEAEPTPPAGLGQVVALGGVVLVELVSQSGAAGIWGIGASLEDDFPWALCATGLPVTRSIVRPTACRGGTRRATVGVA